MSNGILIRRHSANASIDYSAYENQYMTIKALGSGTITFTIPANVNTSYITSISYKKNNGEWITTANSSSVVTISVSVVANDIVEWKGDASTLSVGDGTTNASRINCTALFELYGNIMSLLYEDDFRNKNYLPDKYRTFQELFMESNVQNARNLILPVTILENINMNTYKRMFKNCTSLIYAPRYISIKKVNRYTFHEMYYGCTSMITGSLFDIIDCINDDATYAEFAFRSMYHGCSALQSNLPAEISLEHGFGQQCCTQMFESCSSLKIAPTFSGACDTRFNLQFNNAFQNCTSLEGDAIFHITGNIHFDDKSTAKDGNLANTFRNTKINRVWIYFEGDYTETFYGGYNGLNQWLTSNNATGPGSNYATPDVTKEIMNMNNAVLLNNSALGVPTGWQSYNPNFGNITIWVDDFEGYGNDSQEVYEAAIVELKLAINKNYGSDNWGIRPDAYVYTGEMITLDGKQYYKWQHAENNSSSGIYVLTDTIEYKKLREQSIEFNMYTYQDIRDIISPSLIGVYIDIAEVYNANINNTKKILRVVY